MCYSNFCLNCSNWNLLRRHHCFLQMSNNYRFESSNWERLHYSRKMMLYWIHVRLRIHWTTSWKTLNFPFLRSLRALLAASSLLCSCWACQYFKAQLSPWFKCYRCYQYHYHRGVWQESRRLLHRPCLPPRCRTRNEGGISSKSRH